MKTAQPMPRNLPRRFASRRRRSKPFQSASSNACLQQTGRIAAVVGRAGRSLVGERRLRDQVLAAQRDAVDAGDARRLIDQPLRQVGHVRSASAAIGGGRGRVGEHELMRSIGGGNSVGIDRGRGRRRAGVDERAGVRCIGAHVDQPLDADAEKIAVCIERQRAGELRATPVVIAQDAFGARSNPLDRAPKQLRRQKQRGEFRIDLVAHAKAAADVVSVNANLVGRDTSNVSEAAADVGHALGLAGKCHRRRFSD